MRKEKIMAVETLYAEIEGLEASVAKLTEESAELTRAAAELNAAGSKATEIHAAEKEKSSETSTHRTSRPQ